MHGKTFDLEERTFRFARDIRSFCRTIPQSVIYVDDKRQIIRSSGSIGANYIESREALGKRDSLMRLRISRKEAKECAYFLRLLASSNDEKIQAGAKLLRREAIEIKNILSAILLKST